jgi:RHS repeat-associated protein
LVARGFTYDIDYDPWGQREIDFCGAPGAYGYDADEITTVAPGGRWIADYNENNVRGTYFQHADGLGSVTEWSNQSGALTVNQLFYPFGQSWVGQPGAGDPTQFAGMEHRNPHQFDVTPNRDYSSGWGRWLTPDPGGKNVVHMDDPQTWNMYAYVRNNPTSLTDPSGLEMADPGSTAPGEQDQAAGDSGGSPSKDSSSGGATPAAAGAVALSVTSATATEGGVAAALAPPVAAGLVLGDLLGYDLAEASSADLLPKVCGFSTVTKLIRACVVIVGQLN